MAQDWQGYLLANRERFLAELFDFLRIPSISALPEHASDVERAAVWVSHRLTAAGLESVQILPTGGHPVVYGEWLHAPGKPTIMIYGHFDTQPADPVALWTRPPFEPTLVDDRVYARGAADDKGNMLIPILVVEALLKTHGALPVNLKFFFEGQEEIGSPQLPIFVAAHKELLACDLIASADGAQWAEDQPSLFVGKKGLCGLQIDVIGANSDLHSGAFGGGVQNPLHALVYLLDSMRLADGTIAVEGFYDSVVPLSVEDRALIGAIPFDEQAYTRQLGVAETFGEVGYTTLERVWARPTLEVNGMWGGFQGDGIKTVLPNQAHAKISCRLVPDQDPAEVVRLITAHVEKHTPKGVQVKVTRLPGGAKPYLVPKEHPGNQAAYEVLTEIYGKPPYYTRTGGTIPVTEIFLSNLGAYTIGYAFGLPDENAHAPDEFFRLSSWDRGQIAYGKLLERLGQ